MAKAKKKEPEYNIPFYKLEPGKLYVSGWDNGAIVKIDDYGIFCIVGCFTNGIWDEEDWSLVSEEEPSIIDSKFRIVETGEIPTTLSLDTLEDYRVVFNEKDMEVGCQCISVKDALLLAKTINEEYGSGKPIKSGTNKKNKKNSK